MRTSVIDVLAETLYWPGPAERQILVELEDRDVPEAVLSACPSPVDERGVLPW